MPLTFVITGTSQGLGLEYVKQLSARGDTVVACARNPEKSEELQALVNNKNVYAVTVDITDTNSVKAAAERIKTLAPEGIDVLINNAGVSGGFDQVTTTAPEQFVNVFETNVVGTSNATIALLPLLRKRNTRQIVNISSLMGSIESTKDSAPAAYRVSKAALNMWTKMTANELGEESFKVIALHPGWVKTKMGTDKAPIFPKDSVAGMISVIDNISQETNGKFLSFEGNEIPW